LKLQAEWREFHQQGQIENVDLKQFLTVNDYLATTGELSLTDFINLPNASN
jgi:hypothetical protein